VYPLVGRSYSISVSNWHGNLNRDHVCVDVFARHSYRAFVADRKESSRVSPSCSCHRSCRMPSFQRAGAACGRTNYGWRAHRNDRGNGGRENGRPQYLCWRTWGRSNRIARGADRGSAGGSRLGSCRSRWNHLATRLYHGPDWWTCPSAATPTTARSPRTTTRRRIRGQGVK
jgi:hypothetical protein